MGCPGTAILLKRAEANRSSAMTNVVWVRSTAQVVRQLCLRIVHASPCIQLTLLAL